MGVGMNRDAGVQFSAQSKHSVNVSSLPEDGYFFLLLLFSDGLPFDQSAVQQRFLQRTSAEGGVDVTYGVNQPLFSYPHPSSF